MDASTAITCKNCGDAVSPGMHFCPACGQSARTRRLDLHHILHDLIHVFVHADKGVLYLTRELARRPGQVAREYVEGQRKRYFNPFSYLVLTIAVSAFITNYFHLLDADPQKGNPVSALISKNINLVFLASVPILAAITRMLFYRNRYNYAEHLTLHAFLGGFRVFFYILLFTPLVIFFRQYYYSALTLYLALWTAFTGWAYYQFFGGRKWVIVLKTLLSLVIAQIVMTALILGVVYLRRHS